MAQVNWLDASGYQSESLDIFFEPQGTEFENAQPKPPIDTQNDAIFERRCIFQTWIFLVSMLGFQGVDKDTSITCR